MDHVVYVDAKAEELKNILDSYGVSNAMFSDPFGYMWMLQQVHKEVSFEERIKLWEERRG